MREGPDFVLWVTEIGIVVVLVGLGISAGLFLLFRRWSQKQARLEDERAGAKRRP